MKRNELDYIKSVWGVQGMLGEVKSDKWEGAQTKDDVHKHKLTKTIFLHSDLLTSLSSSLLHKFFYV